MRKKYGESNKSNKTTKKKERKKKEQETKAQGRKDKWGGRNYEVI